MSPADLRTRPTHDSGLQSTELDTHGGGFGVLPPWASSRSTPAAEGLGCCLLVLLEVDTRGSVLPPHGLSNKMDHRRPCSAHCIGEVT